MILSMEYRGCTVRNSLFNVLSKEKVQEAIDYVLSIFCLESMEGTRLASNPLGHGIFGCFIPKKNSITISSLMASKSSILTQAVLVHELVHAVQKDENGCSPLFCSFGSDRSYYSSNVEAEATAIEYLFLKSKGMEILREDARMKFASCGIDILQVASMVKVP